MDEYALEITGLLERIAVALERLADQYADRRQSPEETADTAAREFKETADTGMLASERRRFYGA